MRFVTIKDIAKELRLSIATVSRALNDDGNIRPETKALVVATAKRMGYKKNPVAINLQSRRTRTIGVIVPEMSTPYAARVIDGIQHVCYGHDYKVIITSSAEDAARERQGIDIMTQFRVDGVIACRCNDSENTDLFREFADAGVPLVFYDRVSTGIDVPYVTVDDETKSFFLVEHLIKQGRRHIAFIGIDEHVVYNSFLRYRGYRQALERYGIDFEPALLVRADGMSYSDGATAADKLLSTDVDAIFAFSDILAIGAMNRLQTMGRRIPDDIAVAGFSGTELSTIVTPQLTTVEPHLFEMGCHAAEMIFSLIDGKPISSNKTLVDADIIYRKSTEK